MTKSRYLIVEDDENKRAKIESLLIRSAIGADLAFARSFHSAIEHLTSQSFDFIILDMTLPMFDVTQDDDGGRQEAFAGKELLRQMGRRRIPGRVVVLTQFDRFGDDADAKTLQQLDAELVAMDGERYVGSVHYDERSRAWQSKLLDLLGAEVAPDEGP